MRVTVSAIYIPETGESKTNQIRGLAKEAVTYEYLKEIICLVHTSVKSFLQTKTNNVFWVFFSLHSP